MDLSDFWRSLRQRWYLVLVLVALTGAATYLVAERVGPRYETIGTVLVFPPSESVGPGGQTSPENPYLSLGGVNQARDVVVRALTSKKVSDAFAEQFTGGTEFAIVPDYTNSAPIILFTVEATDPDEAAAALASLMDRVPGELDKLQASLDLSRSERVTSVTLTQDEEPETTYKSMIRAAILAGTVLGSVGLLLIALADGLLAARRRGAEPVQLEGRREIRRNPVAVAPEQPVPGIVASRLVRRRTTDDERGEAS